MSKDALFPCKPSGSFSHKMIIIIALLTILEISSCLQVHDQSSTVPPSLVYNPNQYLKNLTFIQNQFKKDLLAIQGTFTKLNLQLNNTNISSSSEMIRLQQTLAQERNALYNIQNFLNVPFALKSCQCLNFTVQQKAQLQARVNKIEADIKILEVRLYQNTSGNPYVNSKCPNGNCPMVKTLNVEILQLKNYAKIMNATLNSNCCNRTLYVFRNNLAGYSYWTYGNMTYQKYQASVLKQANGTKIATCPASTPFVNVSTNACFACPSNTVYDLGLSKCLPSCQSKGLILDMKTHQCVYNTTCSVGFYWNNVTHKCQISLGSSSRCPLNLPHWNITLLTCQLCPSKRPFFDIHIRACRACTANEIYDPFNRICYSKALYNYVPCQIGFAFNIATGKCQALSTQSVTTVTANSSALAAAGAPPPLPGSVSGCPPSAPYWDPLTLSCATCPTAFPYLNPITKVCEVCPPNSNWNPAVSACVGLSSAANKCPLSQYWNSAQAICLSYPSCTANQYFNNLTKRCVNLPLAGQTGSCPPSAPHWNPLALTCEKCPVNTPLFNITTKVCQKCPSNTAYIITSDTCKPNVTCPSGTVFNTASGTCQNLVCPSSAPIFDTVISKCVACPLGTTYNSATKLCQSNVALQGAVSACPPNTPYWNPARLACEACPLGQRPNPATLQCVPGVSHLLALHAYQSHRKQPLAKMGGL